MSTDKKLIEIVLDIYQEIYKEATPKADFRQLMKLGVVKQEGWFMDYSLSEQKQTKIIDKHCKKHRLTKKEKNRVGLEVTLGCSPKYHNKNNKE